MLSCHPGPDGAVLILSGGGSLMIGNDRPTDFPREQALRRVPADASFDVAVPTVVAALALTSRC